MVVEILAKLVEDVLINQNDKKKIKYLLGEVYYSNENSKFLNEKRISPIIETKSNFVIVLFKDNIARNIEKKIF